MTRRLYWIGLCGLVAVSFAVAGCGSEVQVSRIYGGSGHGKPRPDSARVEVCFDHLPRSTGDYTSRGGFSVTTDNKGTGQERDKVLRAAIAQVRRVGGDVLLVTTLDSLHIAGATESSEDWNRRDDEVIYADYRHPEKHVWYLRGEAFTFTGTTPAGRGNN